MKPYYTPLLFLFLSLTMCAPAQRVQAKTPSAQASPSRQERKQILRYYIRVCRLTYRIRDVQNTENGLLTNDFLWSYPVWQKKMRLQVGYMHTLKEEAKSLKPPPSCQSTNRDLVTCLTLLETAFLKNYQAQTTPNKETDKANAFAAEGAKAAAKAGDFEDKFLAALQGIQTRYDLADTHQFTDWTTTAM